MGGVSGFMVFPVAVFSIPSESSTNTTARMPVATSVSKRIGRLNVEKSPYRTGPQKTAKGASTPPIIV
ncbi:MAG: hypothetical protein JWM91_2711 [Rhodospirillales bacterium]|nr:hypothetical protein [Rhodospirillales bacterium]